MEQHLKKEKCSSVKSFRNQLHRLVLWISLCINLIHLAQAIITLSKDYQHQKRYTK